MHEAKLIFQRGKLNANGVRTPIRLYLNGDRTKVVQEGKDAAFLLAAAGSEIPLALVKKYKLEEFLADLNRQAEEAARAETKAKADAEAKQKADAEAKAKAEADGKGKPEADPKKKK